MKVTLGRSQGFSTVEWKASPLGDILADSVVALLMHAQSSTASIRLTSKPCFHGQSQEVDDGDYEPKSKKLKEGDRSEREQTLLRMFHDTLREQFVDVDAAYEARKATFEIKTDTGLESKALGSGEALTCSVSINFDDDVGVDGIIKVESIDSKLAANVQAALKNVAEAAAPLKL